MFENIIVERPEDHIGLIRLNRPKALNALSSTLMGELTRALADFESDDSIRVIILTGSEKAFAAGADIKEMADKTFAEAYRRNFITNEWESLASCRKPVIAAVAGFALGGGCEVAMMCDFIIAADTAKFGQPEITIGTLPGAGGTQRLARLVGRGRAMEMCLTGRMIDAEEALRIGLAVRVVPADSLLDETLATARKIAQHSPVATAMVKEAVNAGDEMSLSAGIMFERRLFHAAFATKDQKEGMGAFVEKRKPAFTGE